MTTLQKLTSNKNPQLMKIESATVAFQLIFYNLYEAFSGIKSISMSV